MSKIFISYRRHDTPYATAGIAKALISAFGPENVFLDVDNIPLGVDFREILDEKVGQCEVLLAVIGTKWMKKGPGENHPIDDPKDFVRIEIESAFNRDIPIIPLLIEGADIPSEETLPPSINKLAFWQGTRVRAGRDFDRDMDGLVTHLKRDFQKAEQKKKELEAQKAIEEAKSLKQHEEKQQREAEAKRLAAEKAEKERKARERAEAKRLAAEKAEKERKARERAEAKRLAAEKAEKERKARERAEAKRLAAKKREKDRRKKESAANRKAQKEAEDERKAQKREEADREYEEWAAARDKDNEEAATDRKAKEEAEAEEEEWEIEPDFNPFPIVIIGAIILAIVVFYNWGWIKKCSPLAWQEQVWEHEC